MNSEEMKHVIALRALALVEDGMRLGLGSGSTMRYFVDALAKRVVDEKLSLRCVATSQEIHAQANAHLSLIDLDDVSTLDLTIDGADEIDSQLHLIKGAGGALLREKIVATASSRLVIIADERKYVSQLGAFPLAVEVTRFAHATTAAAIANVLTQVETECAIHLRHAHDGTAFVSDGGHYIYDCPIGSITSPAALSDALLRIPGVVEHGLFLNIADAALIAKSDGKIMEIKRDGK